MQEGSKISLHTTWKEGISIYIPNFFNFEKSIVIAWPASRIMLTKNVDNVEKNPKNPCKGPTKSPECHLVTFFEVPVWES